MRHQIKKTKFRHGKDSNKMLLRKLAVNFLKNGLIVTTEAKAKALKPFMEKIVYKAKQQSEANKNFLIKKLADKKIIALLYDRVGQSFQNRVGGYVRITKLGIRRSDGAKIARLDWVVKLKQTDDKKKDLKPKKKEKDSKNETTSR